MSNSAASKIKTWAGTGVLLLGTIGFVYMVANAIMTPAPTHQKRIQQITLVMPPPPPPPVEQPPEPEIEQQVETPPEQPVEADAPASPDLGVDADGSGSGDGFGLVGKKGGRDITEGGPFAWYASQLSSDVSAALNGNSRVRRQKYNVTLKLWIGANGRVEKAELANSTGDRALDEALRVAIAEIGRVREAPPIEMPQPVKLRVSSLL
jgi:protein TonB